MIRPFTFITMLLAALSGAYLFAVKHRAQVLDDQIATISEQSRLDVQRIRVLQAQWALEIDPTRLQQLAAQFTTLQPMQPSQLVTLAALRESLPPPGSAAPGANPALPGQAVPALSNAEVADAEPASALNLPLPPPLPPQRPPQGTAQAVLVASASPAPRVYVHRISHSELHIANTQFAEDLPPPRPLYAPRPSAQSAPMGAQVVSVKATATIPQYAAPPAPAPMPPRLASAPFPSSAASVPFRSGAASAAVNSGSSLGMAADLAPPQPLPQSGLSN